MTRPAAMDGMRRQLALSQQIIAVISASKSAYEQANGLDAKLSSPRAGVSSGLAKTLRKRIAELTGTTEDASIGLSGGSYAVPPVKGVTSFSRINGQASALLEMVESTSDQAPVPSLYRTYSDLCRDFNCHFSRLAVVASEGGGGCWFKACRPQTGHRLLDELLQVQVTFASPKARDQAIDRGAIGCDCLDALTRASGDVPKAVSAGFKSGGRVGAQSGFAGSPRPTAFYAVPRKRSTISGSIGSTASV